ncbi:MAG: acetyl-CoA carboxylase biotin carboxyl carrier protein subunit [Dehalobacterium sp.]
MAILKVKGDITGLVSEIFCQLGDHVNEDDILLEVESMKMLVPLMAPEDGVVKEILVKPGDQLVAGDVAVILEVK